MTYTLRLLPSSYASLSRATADYLSANPSHAPGRFVDLVLGAFAPVLEFPGDKARRAYEPFDRSCLP